MQLQTDFAKLAELFNAWQVAFALVAQSSSATNSVGRLTPNIPRSFA